MGFKAVLAVADGWPGGGVQKIWLLEGLSRHAKRRLARSGGGMCGDDRCIYLAGNQSGA